MLIIFSDVHLGDGTCSKSISTAAFRLFASRLKEMAFNASWHADGGYHPLKDIDIVLLGDILEVQHSTLWLDQKLGEPGYVRPWTDPRAPEFSAKIIAITRAALQNNAHSIAILKALTQAGGLTLPPATSRGEPDLQARERHQVRVRLHFMVGNHDWYYHLPGSTFDAVRRRIGKAFGLYNSDRPFPHRLEESGELQDLLGSFKVYARHGDIFDAINFEKGSGRDFASIGDVFSVEIINRFPNEVQRQLGDDLPPALIESLRELANVRPIMATPLWVYSRLRQNDVRPALEKKVKYIWDGICKEFLALPILREFNRPFRLDFVDKLQLLLPLTGEVSFRTIDHLLVFFRRRIGSRQVSFARHALKEEAFLRRSAQFIVYGHTHRAEVVPLNTFPTATPLENQIYLNSGTWHTYFDLAVRQPRVQEFVPYQVMTYIAFYKGGKRGGRHFETWSGAFS
jgi:hypothetical protein